MFRHSYAIYRECPVSLWVMWKEEMLLRLFSVTSAWYFCIGWSTLHVVVSRFLTHDNAPAHRSVLIKDFLAKNNVTTLKHHPPHPHDLPPADFHLLPPQKSTSKGQSLCGTTDTAGGTRWRSGWGTALQTGRSRDRFPMVSEFFIDIILPVALWPWGRLSL
jgi:hypothetical protein